MRRWSLACSWRHSAAFSVEQLVGDAPVEFVEVHGLDALVDAVVLCRVVLERLVARVCLRDGGFLECGPEPVRITAAPPVSRNLAAIGTDAGAPYSDHQKKR